MDKFLDTNILLRYLLGDIQKHSEFVQNLFDSANEQNYKLLIFPEVVIETKYVLTSFYGFDKAQIIEEIKDILSLGFIEVLTSYKLDFEKVADLYLNKNLSLEDCLYLQICLENNLELVTFDRKLQKIYKS